MFYRVGGLDGPHAVPTEVILVAFDSENRVTILCQCDERRVFQHRQFPESAAAWLR
jgi:hypothetical protein